ncbi:hypothetical protein [Streptomyces sp. CRN 30]|uniref:hypothetical protein n=1 Tax=Streptomyces sp. CRN 30 TaxID=3075613 RepID=UPI002A821E43|nr:hypothetical protein [Streptomyces sp. CRN 30]
MPLPEATLHRAMSTAVARWPQTVPDGFGQVGLVLHQAIGRLLFCYGLHITGIALTVLDGFSEHHIRPVVP